MIKKTLLDEAADGKPVPVIEGQEALFSEEEAGGRRAPQTADDRPVTWKDCYVEAFRETMRLSQQLLGVHALIARAEASGSNAVNISDLRTITGTLPEPNSVTLWAKDGALGRLIAGIRKEYGDRQDAEPATGETAVRSASLEQMLRQFHSALRPHNGLMPTAPTAHVPPDVKELRTRLLQEELRELAEAIEAGDLIAIADAIADCMYLLAGDAVVRGIPLDAVLRAVHASNMTKTNVPGERKLAKGPGFRPPEIAAALGLKADAA